jgi:mono/diheme cytochrome c family protein
MAFVRREEYRQKYEEAKAEGHTFLEHLVRDGVVALALLLLASWLAIRYGAPLEEVADPTTTTFVPRPEWYFYFLFELLWLFPGKWTVIATFWIPTLGFLFLLVLPFLDRGPARSPFRRPAASVVGMGVVAGVLFLTYKGATAPAPPGRVSVDLAKLPPELQKGREVYEAQGCGACHMIRGEGGAAGPDLSRIGSIRDEDSLRRFIKDPQSVKPGSPMPDSKGLADESLNAIARYLASLK